MAKQPKAQAVQAAKPAPAPVPAATPAPAVEEAVPAGRFWRRVDWSAFWTAFVLSFGVYAYTMAPTVTLEDSGELAVAGDYLGVPHPPGYPIWTMFAWLFAKVFAFVPFRGQPNPAWGITLFSVVCGAVAAGLTAMLICRSGSDMLRHSKKIAFNLSSSTDDLICWVGGVVCSLVFAFTPCMWSQTVIVEVYALNALFLILVFVLTYQWMVRPSDHLLYVTAFVFGLGLTNYQVLLLAAIPLVFAIFLRDLRLFRDLAIGAAPFVIAVGLIQKGMVPWISHPLETSGFVYLLLDAVTLVLVWMLLPRGRTVALTILLAQLGVAFYIYMPIVSDLRNPPMNWGYPRTWEGFKHAITRGQYEKITPTGVFSMVFLRQIGDYLTDLRAQFTVPVALLGFLPFTAWHVRVGGRRMRAMYTAIMLAIVASGMVLVEEVFFPGGIASVTLAYKFLIAGIVLLLVIGGIAITFAQVREIFRDLVGAPRIEPDENAVFRLEIDSSSQKWIIATLLAFLSMSLILINLANPKGDIQDEFIQRVKFISSHALFAFWVGYGLIYGLASVETIFRENRIVKWLSLGTALLIPLIPIQQNAYNKELVRVSGGSEMTGHDFGWQFGNYQLRGADAVLEELVRDENGLFDEEPVPNPAYPPEMTTNAIFFGGTDPGRFVPTYMIYSARVREDVYLITQNALADNTYMNVMRDLYGDRIWIPAQQDSAKAFQRYVEEVQSGKRPRNADLKIENGRVSVSGALGVMEINGILCEAIFEKNNYKNDFYVEESYVIRWMYPYLTPHGLIMKLNRNVCDIPQENTINDMDFWDWYTRRLMNDRKFLRDVVARKSFSKLRSAVAGLYASRQKFREGEIAFKQARLLYPLSPEANFRLVGEVLMPFRRFAESKYIMTEFGEQDPGNTKVFEFLDQLKGLDGLYKRIADLEAKRNEGKMDVNLAMELADCYLNAQQPHLFMNVMNSILATTNLPPQIHYNAAVLLRKAGRFAEMSHAIDLCVDRMGAETPPDVFMNMAQMYSGANMPDRMAAMLQKYLTRRPTDWRGWLDFAILQLQMGRSNEASKALEQAVRVGGNEALAIISQDQRLAPLRGAASAKSRGLIGVGY